jgi:hypothetical protein
VVGDSYYLPIVKLKEKSSKTTTASLIKYLTWPQDDVLFGLVCNWCPGLAISGAMQGRKQNYVGSNLLPQASVSLLQSVIYGIFPAAVLGGLFSWLHLHLKQKPLVFLRQAILTASHIPNLRKVYRFSSPDQVRPDFLRTNGWCSGL